jgi:hypothetical protein
MTFSTGIDVDRKKLAAGIAKVNVLFIAPQKHCKTVEILV